MNDGTSLGRRRTGHRAPTKLMVIAVEGMSEKIYFERFRTPGSPITVRLHTSKDHTAEGMVERCIDLMERSGLEPGTDNVAAVFDADINTAEEIERAKEMALKHGVEIYVSNPSFEFWLLLHFEDNRVDYIQSDIEELLGKYTGTRYKKSEGINKHISDEDVKKAIDRSYGLLCSNDPVACKNSLPSTCLHLLVEKLIKK